MLSIKKKKMFPIITNEKKFLEEDFVQIDLVSGFLALFISAAAHFP